MSSPTYRDQLLDCFQHQGSTGDDVGTPPITAQASNIIHLFDALETDANRLADELYLCYEHLNIAFDATEQVSMCRTTQRAITVLNSIITAAVEAQFSFYLGELTRDFSLLQANTADSSGVTTYASDFVPAEVAQAFFARNERSLHELAQSACEAQVFTMDYHGKTDHDNIGRGNVLAVTLQNIEEDIGYLGTMIFVRSDEQDLFSAVHLNLAQSLVRIGTASLGNIIYAQKLQHTYLQTINTLVRAMEAKDPYTSGHSTRVADMAVALGKRLDLSKDHLGILEWAGLVHDIGKIGIQDAVLRKPGKLTNAEFEHIKTHPVKSQQVLEPVDGLQSILAVVRHHHEHYDGGGYPDGLRGDQIPYLARIIQVADVWDAITSSRSYRQAMPVAKALNIMRQEAGTTMDPAMVALFLDMIETDPALRQAESNEIAKQ